MKNILLIIILLQSLLIAEGVSVDAQIAEIQAASPQERVNLMNAFKVRISQMNKEERASAIKQMQSKREAKSQMMTSYESMEQRAFQNSEAMMQHQNMNQKQMADQAMHQNESMREGMGRNPNAPMGGNMGQHK